MENQWFGPQNLKTLRPTLKAVRPSQLAERLGPQALKTSATNNAIKVKGIINAEF